MNKNNKQNLLMTIIFTLVVSFTLFYMYDNFSFQTYSEVVYFDYILEGENDNFKVENVEAYYNKNNFSLGGGRIIFKDINLIEAGLIPSVQLILKNDNQKFEYEVELNNYQNDNPSYSIEKVIKGNKKINLDDIDDATLVIKVSEQKVDQLDLKVTPIVQLEGSNKEYRIENASISDQMMRLGSLKTTDEEFITKYPTLSLEYRYIKDPKKDKEDNDNYVVFKKITGKSKELINSDDYGSYYLEEGSFKDKSLSIVIIFSNEDDKFAFAIDLVTRQVGDYYG